MTDQDGIGPSGGQPREQQARWLGRNGERELARCDATRADERRVIVYKIGGSLLSQPNLDRRLRQVRALNPDTNALFLVGGGPTADLVRQWDRIHHLGEERSHWLALKSLQLNQALLADLVPNAVVVENPDGMLRAWENDSCPIADAYEFLLAAERTANRLPHNWTVTGDSIAAWLACRLQASELILLKSRSLPDNISAAEATECEFIDCYFPHFVDQLERISWVDMSNDKPEIEAWLF